MVVKESERDNACPATQWLALSKLSNVAVLSRQHIFKFKRQDARVNLSRLKYAPDYQLYHGSQGTYLP